MSTQPIAAPLSQTLAAIFAGGRFPHALLLEGESATLCLEAAMNATALLLCKGDAPPCGVCTACRKLQSRNHPDFYWIQGGDKPLSIKVDTVRQLRRDAYLVPHEAMRKVFLISNAQNMTAEAQNALLKILEEPPATTCFILTAPSKTNLLETVSSRVTSFYLPPQSVPLSEGASQLVTFALSAQKYELLCLLAAHQKERETMLSLLQEARIHAIALCSAEHEKMSPLRCKRFTDILEEAMKSTQANVGLPLISAVVAGQLCSV